MSNSIAPQVLAAAFRHSDGLQVLIDANGVICAANARWTSFAQEQHACPSACGLGANYFEVCRRAAAEGEVAAERVLQACIDALRDGESRHVEYCCASTPDSGNTGAGFWYRLRIVRIDDGHLLLDHADISAQETALQRASRHASQAAFQRLILEGIAQPVIATDMHGTVTYWNRSAEALFGYTAEEAIGRAITDVTVPETDLAQAEEIMRTLAGGRSWTGEFWVRHRDGTRFPARVSNIPMLDTEGRVVGIVGVSDDLRPQYEREAQQQKMRDLEAQLLQRQKMEALGTVAGGVAHEFNNVLAAIVANAEFLHDHCASDESAKSALDGIVHASARARDVIKALLTFSRPQSSDRASVDAERWLRSAMRMIESTTPHDVSLSVQFDAPPLTVLANETQLTQVLLNLAGNACYAMRHRPRRELRVHAWLDGSPHGDHLVLEVSDTGAGMDEAIRTRVFDPFFTTKPVGEGSGLGLAVVHGVVQAHGGSIHIDSQPGEGTTVMVRLPASVGEASATTDDTPIPSNSVRGHVVIVDDERMVLTALSRVLERAGFTVSAFERPAAALRFVALHPQAHTFAGAIIDYCMPGMRGDELARRLALTGFRAPMILCTGNTTEVGDVGQYIQHVVEKPVTGADLVALLSGLSRAA